MIARVVTKCLHARWQVIKVEHLKQGILKGEYHFTIDLLFDWFGISSMTTDNFCFYLQNIKSKQAKQEVNCTLILPPLVFPLQGYADRGIAHHHKYRPLWLQLLITIVTRLLYRPQVAWLQNLVLVKGGGGKLQAHTTCFQNVFVWCSFWVWKLLLASSRLTFSLWLATFKWLHFILIVMVSAGLRATFYFAAKALTPLAQVQENIYFKKNCCSVHIIHKFSADMHPHFKASVDTVAKSVCFSLRTFGSQLIKFSKLASSHCYQ